MVRCDRDAPDGTHKYTHKYWTYIVASRTGTLYIGVTGKLYVRVQQHKAGEIEGFSSTDF